MDNIIKESADGWMNSNELHIRGTNVQTLGDLLADILVLIPKKTAQGYVSWSVYQQAEELYSWFKPKLFRYSSVYIKGHSLGGGVAVLIAQMLLNDGYTGDIHLRGQGSLKVISVDVANWLGSRLKEVTWQVNHRDIVPHLGWWSEPINFTPREGRKRKHIFDWSLSAHVSY